MRDWLTQERRTDPEEPPPGRLIGTILAWAVIIGGLAYVFRAGF